jgi:hypothetical protein
MVAALFVETGGCYYGLPDVDPWDLARDARLYAGPHPVVAHPPCERWGRVWWADGSTKPGDDGGCFAAAVAAVRRWGGVIEHPEASLAWAAFQLPRPERGGWARSLFDGGWSAAVAQRNYEHRARKMTWLYYVGDAPPPAMDWSDPGAGGVYLSQPGRCQRGKPRKRCPCRRCADHFGDSWEGGMRVFERMGARENAATPLAFRDELLALARRAQDRGADK